MIVTRFNPSANGNLHLGHLFTLLVNEYFAHSVGGKFAVRFDDTTPKLPKERIQNIVIQQINDINWLDIAVNVWQNQTDLEFDVMRVLASFEQPPFPIERFDPEYPELPVYTRYIGTTWLPYPYVPNQIAERVIMDRLLGVTHVIRGEEFATEYSLYHYFSDKFGFEVPKFIYLPRLSSRRGDISKTAGGYTIAELRGCGYTAQDVKDLVAKACLILPANGWNIYNLKRDPCIDL